MGWLEDEVAKCAKLVGRHHGLRILVCLASLRGNFPIPNPCAPVEEAKNPVPSPPYFFILELDLADLIST